jgi:hypothetical protein
MNGVLDDRFLVFVRADRDRSTPPEEFEQDMISCSTYEDAQRIKRELRGIARECVIRYLGPTGGGD